MYIIIMYLNILQHSVTKKRVLHDVYCFFLVCCIIIILYISKNPRRNVTCTFYTRSIDEQYTKYN